MNPKNLETREKNNDNIKGTREELTDTSCQVILYFEILN